MVKDNNIIAAVLSWQMKLFVNALPLKILASATDELVAKEAAYHLCCSRKFTESFNSSQRENKNEISLIQEAFDAINHMLPGLYEGSNVTEFSDFTNKAVESLHNLNQEDASL